MKTDREEGQIIIITDRSKSTTVKERLWRGGGGEGEDRQTYIHRQKDKDRQKQKETCRETQTDLQSKSDRNIKI